MHVVYTRLYMSPMYYMCDYLNNYLKVSFFFFPPPTSFFSCFLLPPNIVLNLGHLISLSTIKKKINNLSLFTMINLTFLSLSLSLSLAIHLRQPSVLRCHRHHHPQEPYLTPLRCTHLPPLLICYFSWPICEFFRVRVLGFNLGFLLILPNLTIIWD